MKKYLIAGLGNIGAEYENTRHNIGFKILDAWAHASNTSFETNRYAQTSTIRFKGRQFILIKPTTYMNLSGKAVNFYLQKENISAENLLVVTDDLALPFGTIRIKTKGSDGGHNGHKHIIQTLGHSKYARLRFGIGDEFSKGHQVNYVLGGWSKQEDLALTERIDTCIEAIKSFGTSGAGNTMSQFNGK